MTRKKFPSRDFYYQDFALGVRGLDRGEVGDYIRLLCAIWDTMNETLPLDVNVLRFALDCRHRDVAPRIAALVNKGKIYVGNDGLIHNFRTDRDKGVEPAQKPLSGFSAASVEALMSRTNRNTQAKSMGDGTSSRARAPVPLPNIDNLPLSSLDDLAAKKSNGSASATHGSRGLKGRSPAPPSERESTGPPREPPDYSRDPVQTTAALLKSKIFRSPK